MRAGRPSRLAAVLERVDARQVRAVRECLLHGSPMSDFTRQSSGAPSHGLAGSVRSCRSCGRQDRASPASASPEQTCQAPVETRYGPNAASKIARVPDSANPTSRSSELAAALTPRRARAPNSATFASVSATSRHDPSSSQAAAHRRTPRRRLAANGRATARNIVLAAPDPAAAAPRKSQPCSAPPTATATPTPTTAPPPAGASPPHTTSPQTTPTPARSRQPPAPATTDDGFRPTGLGDDPIDQLRREDLRQHTNRNVIRQARVRRRLQPTSPRHTSTTNPRPDAKFTVSASNPPLTRTSIRRDEER